MKNISGLLCLMLLLSFPVLTHSQNNYQSALNKLNAYLKTFDNGYYGYLEVKDGYLWGRFPSGKYTKTLLNKLGSVTESEINRKVSITCKDNQDCVYSTYTDSYHPSLSFSQSKDFNTGELITLLNNFLDAYNNKSNSNSNSSTNAGYQAPLKKLNAYLKTFDNGYYGYFEVKDGYIWGRFASGKYTRTSIGKLGKATESEINKKVIVSCKDNDGCVYSTYTDSYHQYLQFSQDAAFNTGELITLLNNFISAVQEENTGNEPGNNQISAHAARLQSQGERVKPHTGNIDPAKYSKQLAALNAYLKTFNSATYGEVTVKDGKVYFDFKVSGTYYSYITISDLLNQTSVLKMPDEIKIACNSGSKCFYSSYLKNNTDHFRFYSLTVKDLTKMKQLVDDFVNALR